jgi:tripartite-type tricarboxylate transporter receptor subunit TctC
MPRMLTTLFAAASVAVALAAPAAAQDYPAKPVRIVVPFAPGGLNDIAARLFAPHLSERLGKQFVVDNRTGAGGVVGSEIVANAPKDGYTLLIASIAHAVNPSLYKLPYDPVKAFDPVAMFVSSPNALAVTPGLPAKTVKEFVALAKAKPGSLLYASGGIGGSLHLGYELFKLTAGIDVVHVPFKGAGPAVIDVAGGHSQSIIATITTLIPHHKSGKLRLLGVSGSKRSAIMPDLPTIEEQGLKYEAGNWIGLVAPAGTPRDVIEKLNKEIAEIQKLPDVQKRMQDSGADIVTMTPAEFGKYMNEELDKWGKVVKQAGIKAQ